MDRFCTNCGAPLTEDARFCPRCGKEAPVVPEPFPPAAPQPVRPAAPQPVPTIVPPPPRHTSRAGLLVGVAIAVVALGLIAWAILAGMPYGHKREPHFRGTQPDVVTESTAATSTASVDERSAPATQTVSRIGEPPDAEERDTSTATSTTATVPLAPTVTTTTVQRLPPPPAAVPPATTTSRAMTEDEAVNIVRGYVTANRYYDLTPECIGVAPIEYQNRGYTLDVVDRCGGAGRVGRWRVDAVTREVFVQRPDGRYLRP